MSRLTPDQLARQAGTSTAQVERFVELGFLEHREGRAPFDVRDIHRVRFAEAIDAAGISLVDVARLVEAGKYSFTSSRASSRSRAGPCSRRGSSRGSSSCPGRESRRCTRMGSEQHPREDDERALRGRAEVRDLGLDMEAVVVSSRFAAAFEPIGEIGLRGVVEPVALFRALIRDNSPTG